MSLPIKVLVVGVGSIGERHLRCFQATGRAELSLCEVNPALRQAVAERYNVANAFADLPTALGQNFDAAIIATPAHLHIPMAIQLADAGLDLLIEKPVSTSLEGIEPLRERLSQKQLVAAIAYVYAAHPALTAMKQAVDSGRFGRPLQIVAVSGQHFPTYRPAYREIYYKDHATGGGAVQDALTHVINAGERLVGPVDRLAADIAHLALPGVEVEDSAHVIARHGSVLGSYSLNQHQAPNEMTMTVICERGTVRFEYHNTRWRWMTEPGTDWQDEQFGPLERDEMFIRQANAFLDAVERKAAPLCTLEQGVQTLAVNLAILAAAREQCWLSVR